MKEIIYLALSFSLEIKDFLKNLDYSQENVVVILSNGSFDGLPGFVREL